ncbi:hypothetical protein Tco_0723848 [Tanacetum coccineum]
MPPRRSVILRLCALCLVISLLWVLYVDFIAIQSSMVGCLFLNVRDPLLSDDLVDFPLMDQLNSNRTLIRRNPEEFLCAIGLSRTFVDPDVRPTFLGLDKNDMGLLDFVKYADPFKVKVG